MGGRRVYLGISAILLTLCLVSLLPLLGLYLEFSGLEFCGQSYWTYIARLYGSYFLFPLLGLIAGILLIVPLSAMWLIVSRESYRRLTIYALAGWVTLVVVASGLEFTGSPNALFEVAPTALSHGAGKTFFERFSTACGAASFAYKGKFDGSDDSYQTELSKAIVAGKSYSTYLYYFVIPFQAAFLFLFVVAIFLISYFRKPFISDFLARERLSWEKDNIFLLFGLALMVGGLWFLYRLAYRADHDQLFGGSTSFSADAAAFWLYFSIIVIYITLSFDLEKLAKTIAQVASAATLLGLSILPSKYSGQFFGLGASVQNVLALVVLLCILIGIGLVFNAAPPVLSRAEPDDG